MTDYVENKIFSDNYNLFDRTLYGGVGHGVIIIPTNIFKVLFTKFWFKLLLNPRALYIRVRSIFSLVIRYLKIKFIKN